MFGSLTCWFQMDPPLDFEIEFEDDALPEPGCSSEDLNIKADDSRTKIELQWLENYKQVTEKSNMHTLPMDEFISKFDTKCLFVNCLCCYTFNNEHN